MDDIIGEMYDADGNRSEITLKQCYQSYFNCVRLLYHDYMVRIIDGDFTTFKKMHLKTTAKIVDMIHYRCADHVEGIRMEFLEKNNITDPRRSSLDG